MTTASITAVSRRSVLRGAAGLSVAFAFAGQALGSPAVQAGDEVDSFLVVAPDGAVTIYAGKVDLGTGARIALPQIVADEMGAAISRISLVEGDTALTPDQGGTGGSTGISVGGAQIRRAAATARERLLALGAERLGVSKDALVAEDGEVRLASGGGGFSFATLLAGKNFALKVDPKVLLKRPDEFRFIGKPLARPDVRAKMTAAHVYVQDLRLPGMLHARVLRAPSIGAKLLSVDESSIAAVPGARVVRIRDFLAVLAPTEWNAIRASNMLRSEWKESPPEGSSNSLFDDIRQTAVIREEVLRVEGDPGPALAAAKEAGTVRGSYYWPIQSHASLGPSCAVADVRSDRAVVWTASQGGHRLGRVLARLLKLDPGKLRVVYADGSGSYGTNGNDDAAADAALLSKAVGAPVRVQWSRQDELGWDPKGPPHVLDMRAALDGRGGISAWESVAYLPMNTPSLPAIPLLAPEAAGLEQMQGITAGLLAGNAAPPYAIPAVRASVKWLATTPLRPSNLRAPGKVANVFAVESFVDEIAAAARVDPLAFRLERLKQSRGQEVLRRVGNAMAWEARPSPGAVDRAVAVSRGRGIAYVHYKQSENFVAMGMEVAVERATGIVRVERVVCAHDCGLMINPDTVHAQVEGCIIQTISRTLFEEVIFEKGRVTSTDWNNYPILTMPDVPRLEIILIDRPLEPALGVGEAAAAPVGAAIANAVFDATGIRLRTVPLTPGRVKAALRAS
jgi:nicotinate dehydrogenase subunit B